MRTATITLFTAAAIGSSVTISGSTPGSHHHGHMTATHKAPAARP